jgi:AraC family transcriptional regulator, regulatory protein of adaptative response / methylated-DNA-[protein]-cysteine methyltransferase
MEFTMNTMRRETASEAFRLSYGASAIGTFLVALSDRGITAILLGDDRQKLRRELERAFPDVLLIEDGAACADAVAKVAALIDAPRLGLALALDMRGSAVECAVWTALRAIPSGETRSYGALAKSLPVAATAQEVGAACAANVLAVAVPCHRVVKADGSISGYRWGVRRKRRLINQEGVA